MKKMKGDSWSNISNIIWSIVGLLSLLFLLNLYFGWVDLSDTLNLPFGKDNAQGTGGDTLPDVVKSCSDTDLGRDLFNPGHITANGDLTYYDTCQDTTMLIEYYCSGTQAVQEYIACPLGYECYDTRSGGYCNKLNPTYSNGELLGSGSGSGITSESSNIFEIDLGNLVEGNCQLAATIDTGWDYANDKCQGIQGSAGVTWTFSDSDSVEYTRTDTTPVSMGVPISCGLDYDGTPFTLKMEKTASLPDCQINYEWSVRVVTCNCQ